MAFEVVVEHHVGCEVRGGFRSGLTFCVGPVPADPRRLKQSLEDWNGVVVGDAGHSKTPRFQVVGDHVTHRRVVVNDKNVHSRRRLAPRHPPVTVLWGSFHSLPTRSVWSRSWLRLSGQAPPSSMLRAGTGSVCEIPHSSWSFAVPSLTRRPFAIEALNDAGPTGGRSARSATCWRNAQRLRPTLPWCRCSPRLCRIPSKSWPLGTGCHRCRCFHINLYLPQVGASDIAVELARHIRQQFSARYRRAA